jgi:two-component system cell cycle sensor histidine kinase/response regulator CckA
MEDEADRDVPGALRILVVDDESGLVGFNKWALMLDGFSVSAHTSGASALDEFSRAPDRFALLITDNNMPEMTGLELVEKLRACRPDLPVLIVSGGRLSMSAKGLSGHGTTRFLGKPYTAEELRNAVGSFFEGRDTEADHGDVDAMLMSL